MLWSNPDYHNYQICLGSKNRGLLPIKESIFKLSKALISAKLKQESLEGLELSSMTTETIFKANSPTEGAKAEVAISRRMEAISKEILEIMWLMVLESTSIDQGTNTKAYGRITWQMAKDKLTTLMEVATMENF